MKKFKKILSLALAGLFAASAIWQGAMIESEAAEYWPANVSITSGAAIVVEMETGTVLYENNADTSYYPASITKIMTALLALENCDLDEIVTFSEEAVYDNEGDTSHIAREVGEEMTLENCLYGMMLESANECAWAIGEHVGGGSMDTFVEMMNAKAAELGCTHTHFANPNGLPDADHYVSARDMALIARAAYQIPKFREICGTTAYTIPADNKKEAYNCNNTHAMISAHRTSSYLYEYALGGKTGYTDEAGNTLVTFAKKDGMTLLCVILSGKNPSHYVDTINLFNYCFANFSTYNVAENTSLSSLADGADTGLLSEQIDLIRIDTGGTVVLPNTASFSDATATIVPVNDDTGAVAQVVYTYADKQVGSANLIYEANTTVSYPFNNISEENGGSAYNYIRIDFKTVLLFLLAVAVIIGIVYAINLQSGKIFLSVHRLKDGKGKNSRQKTMQQRRSKQIRRNYRRRRSRRR